MLTAACMVGKSGFSWWVCSPQERYSQGAKVLFNKAFFAKASLCTDMKHNSHRFLATLHCAAFPHQAVTSCGEWPASNM